MPPPMAQNFLNFMQSFTNFGKIICWRPPPRGLAPPPTGNPGSAPTYTIQNSILYVILIEYDHMSNHMQHDILVVSDSQILSIKIIESVQNKIPKLSGDKKP